MPSERSRGRGVNEEWNQARAAAGVADNDGLTGRDG